MGNFIKTLSYGVGALIIGYNVMTLTSSNGPSSAAFISATKAYEKYAHKGDYLVIIDFTLPSNKKREWIYDSNQKLIYNTYVTHGKNSGGLYATKFSNTIGSLKSSLGAMRVGETYYGKHGLSLKLDGLEKQNSNVRKRAIVIHGASYAEASYIKANGRAGLSWGCPAIPQSQSKYIINLLKSGAIVYIYGT